MSLELGARMLLLADAAASVADAKQKLMDALESGRGFRRLRAMITAQGGDPACCDDVTPAAGSCGAGCARRFLGYVLYAST